MRLDAILFPGRRAVWIGALAVLVVATFFSVRLLLARTASLTGTNSVDVASVVAEAKSGERVCIRDLFVPRATGGVEVSLAVLQARRGARWEAIIEHEGQRLPLRHSGSMGPLSFVSFTTNRALQRDLPGASVCLLPVRMKVAFGGAFVQRLPTAPVTTVAGVPLVPGDIAVKFRLKEGRSSRVWDAVPSAIRRATVFESAAGTVFMWATLPSLVLLLYFVVRVAATAEERPVHWLATAVVVVTFAYAACWAVLLHPFHGADESEHFAYAQYYAATNHPPDSSTDSKRPPYSSSQLRLMEALHHNSTILNPSSKLRWEDYWDRKYQVANHGSKEGDGGGYTVSATGHSPLYYAVIGIPYRVFGGPRNIPSVLLAMRLLNALFASLIAGLALLTAAAVFRGQHGVAWLAGIITGLQPVYGSVAASVNNDTAVNLLGALFVYLIVNAWATGPTRGNAVAVGASVVALPIAKVTGFALVPVLAVAVGTVVIRYGLSRGFRWGALVMATGGVAIALWVFALSPMLGAGRGRMYNVHRTPISAGVVAAPAASITLSTRMEYFVQTFLPKPTIGTNHWQLPGAESLDRWPAYAIYIKRGYGLFGWNSAELTPGMYRGIFAALVVGWLAAVWAAISRRRRWREWLGGVVLLGVSLMAVLAFISYAYSTNDVRADIGEQGRYVFLALVPLSAAVSGGVLAFRGRARQVALGLAVTGAGSFAVIAWLTALRGWFT